MMPAKPTVFVFATAYHPLIGGAEIAIQEVSRRLADEYRFFIITGRMRRDLPQREARPEGTITRIGFGASLDKWFLPLAAPFVFFRERGDARAVLWGMDISTGALAAAFTKLLSPRTPFVLTIQYGYGGGRLRHGRFGAIGRAFRWMLLRADAVTAISNYLAAEAAQFGYRRPVKLLHNGVHFEAFLKARSSRSEKSPPTIITVSRLVPKNGGDVIIRALPEIQKSFPDVRCHILGSGPERSRLEELSRSLGVAPAVTFFGDVPYADLPRRLAAADVFVRPSRSEGMGNAFVEALAAGLPVVGTPVEGILDIIADGTTGLFAKVDDSADVAAKTVRLLGDKALSRQIAGAGRAMVRERFSWDAIASGYAEVFRAAMLPRILIATPMLPPDIGGPGAYARGLADELARRGHRVAVLSYGAQAGEPFDPVMRQERISLSAPLPVRLLRYALAAWRMLGEADIAIALDPVAVGGPLAIASRMRGKPFVIRVEGDALWERYVERTGDALTLRQFYAALPHLQLSRPERAWHRMARWVFPQAQRIVFSSRWREEIFQTGYALDPLRSVLIGPPLLVRSADALGGERDHGERERTLVFAGRFVRVKNIHRLIRAFLDVADPDYRLELIGEGPERPDIEALTRSAGGRISIVPSLPPEALAKRIASVHAFVLPSLSDVSPNVILECIATGTPFLLTRESGFRELLKGVGLFANPLDEADITAKLKLLLDPNEYAAYRERLRGFRQTRSWDEAGEDWLAVIRACL